MKLTFSIIMFVCVFSALQAQDIVGVWKTIDDRTNLPTSHVEIYKLDNTYYGKVVAMLRDDPATLCSECKGDKKNEPIMGMVILRDMKKENDIWSSGYIMDPENGKEYKCNIYMKSNLSLELRGYIGAPLFGRSQDWIRVK